ncbi:MAG: flagellar hook-associated protein FlgK [Spirochaetes bacterium]|nr:flagellar hook-associated protein FlgK [Spirochaetota bacterium]MBP8991033.1 flagellar hook-associated protein FlgK [Spirochaetota bacterium]
MFSTFMGIEIAKRALQNSQQTIYITQNNISNSENPDYNRQTVTLKEVPPLWLPGVSTMGSITGQVGQGSIVALIDRVKDMFLDGKISSETSSFSYFNILDKYIRQLEGVLGEPAGATLDTALKDFFNSFNSLSMDPQSMEKRILVTEKARNLVDKFHQFFNFGKNVQKELNESLQIETNNVNNLFKELASLNKEIKRIEATGQKANDLKDRRDMLVGEISKFVPVTFKETDKFYLYINGKIAVQDDVYHEIELVSDNSEGMYKLYFQNDRLDVSSGSLKGLIDARDELYGGFLEKLNQFAVSIIESVNSIHLQGMNAKGESGIAFFKELPLTIYKNGEYDKNQDGINDNVVIYKIVGSKTIEPDQKVMVEGKIVVNGVEISYNPSDTVMDIIKKVNMANTGINLYIQNGKLEIKGNSSADGIYSIKNLSDSGQFLSNIAGVLSYGSSFSEDNLSAIDSLFSTDQIYTLSFEKNAAAWIDLSEEISMDPLNIAAAENYKELKEGDGRIAQKISVLMDSKFLVRNSQSLLDFYSSMVMDIAANGRKVSDNLASHELTLGSFKNMKLSYSGVNMDEELANMLKFQKAYQAAAKFLTQQNELYDILMGIIR